MEQELPSPLEKDSHSVFYLVERSVSRYLLDSYPLASLLDHHGQQPTADVIAAFLPREVVDSLYSVMQEYGLKAVSLTLEPIAVTNAAIPQSLRLLNLALVDIGAGTSDIAVSKDGGVADYTIITIASGEITEALIWEYLVGSPAMKEIRVRLRQGENVSLQNTLGLEQQVSMAELKEKITPVL